VIVLGIDPGSRVTGWGAVTRDRGRYVLVRSGAVRTRDSDAMPARLLHIHERLRGALAETNPTCVAVEAIFAHRSSTSALVLGQARGVALLAAAEAGVPVHEYNASTVKKTVTGSGRAEKEQVQRAVAMLLGMRVQGPPDEADAIAIAMTHLAHAGMQAARAEAR
jgi:crossover junction endodeoxyribonuclease RuvC